MTANPACSELPLRKSTPAEPAEPPRLSVILGTYNRSDLLSDAIRSVLAQDDATVPAYELIVVDNNSTDGTRTICTAFAMVDSRVRYVFEPRQGLAHARNAGLRESRAPLIAFVDDDVRAGREFVAAVVRTFEEHPDVDLVGGRVLPIWPSAPPEWLTREQWTPLALVDYGDAPVSIDADRPICLVGANLAIRRSALDRVGLFASGFQRVKDGVGSLEDYEFLLRVLRTGHACRYEPRIVVHAEVQSDRLKRAYHRRWHRGHGHFHALLRSEHLEQTCVGTLFGVPAHLYRQAFGDLVGWLRATAVGDRVRAFGHEVRLQFFRGFLETRGREFLRKPPLEQLAELLRLLRVSIRRREPLVAAGGESRE